MRVRRINDRYKIARIYSKYIRLSHKALKYHQCFNYSKFELLFEHALDPLASD